MIQFIKPLHHWRIAHNTHPFCQTDDHFIQFLSDLFPIINTFLNLKYWPQIPRKWDMENQEIGLVRKKSKFCEAKIRYTALQKSSQPPYPFNTFTTGAFSKNTLSVPSEYRSKSSRSVDQSAPYLVNSRMSELPLGRKPNEEKHKSSELSTS